ncbi:hypothetical protein HKX48_005992 [Thoreauomyces humboldtii]|nr:hypothetical protein HKX48_005992 [Thoreauomyces humboldtii]
MNLESILNKEEPSVFQSMTRPPLPTFHVPLQHQHHRRTYSSPTMSIQLPPMALSPPSPYRRFDRTPYFQHLESARPAEFINHSVAKRSPYAVPHSHMQHGKQQQEKQSPPRATVHHARHRSYDQRLHSTRSSSPAPSAIVKPKRKRATAAQLQSLTAVFNRTHFPSTELRARLAADLEMTPRAVQIWFQNRRQAIRTRGGDSGKDVGTPSDAAESTSPSVSTSVGASAPDDEHESSAMEIDRPSLPPTPPCRLPSPDTIHHLAHMSIRSSPPSSSSYRSRSSAREPSFDALPHARLVSERSSPSHVHSSSPSSPRVSVKLENPDRFDVQQMRQRDDMCHSVRYLAHHHQPYASARQQYM